MNFDGIYTPPADSDPLSGVTVWKFTVDTEARTFDGSIRLRRKSGAIVDTFEVRLVAEEFDAFASAAYPGEGVGLGIVAALVAMGRIPNVSAAAKLGTSPVVTPLAGENDGSISTP